MPLASGEIETAWRAGEHGRIVSTLLARLRVITHLYSAMYLGSDYVIAPFSLQRTEPHQKAASEGNPGQEL